MVTFYPAEQFLTTSWSPRLPVVSLPAAFVCSRCLKCALLNQKACAAVSQSEFALIPCIHNKLTYFLSLLVVVWSTTHVCHWMLDICALNGRIHIWCPRCIVLLNLFALISNLHTFSISFVPTIFSDQLQLNLNRSYYSFHPYHHQNLNKL